MSGLDRRTSLPPLHPTSLPYSLYVETFFPSSPSPMTSEVERLHLTQGTFCRYGSVVDMVKSWHQEKQHYSFPHPRECNPRCPSKCSGSVCSHYTQVSTEAPHSPPTAAPQPPRTSLQTRGQPRVPWAAAVQGAALLPAAAGIRDQILAAACSRSGSRAGSRQRARRRGAGSLWRCPPTLGPCGNWAACMEVPGAHSLLKCS